MGSPVDYERVIVIDNRGTIKAGFGGEKTPRCEFPTVIGRPKVRFMPTGEEWIYVGRQAFEKRGILCLKTPLDRGMIMNWDDMEMVNLLLF